MPQLTDLDQALLHAGFDNLESLADLRENWDGDRTVKLALPNKDRGNLLVVLEENRQDSTPHQRYSLHRYFPVGFGDNARWEISVDGSNVRIDTVFKWLQNPSAHSGRDQE